MENSGEPRGFSPEIAEKLPAVVEGNIRFGLDVYAALRSREGNLFFSPFSLGTALAMTYAGAAGKTAMEMAKVLHLPERRGPVHAVYGALMDRARVDEKGTEAAAASAVVMEVTSAPAGSVFRADHPFLFFLRDTSTGSLLFMGRLAEPGGQTS